MITKKIDPVPQVRQALEEIKPDFDFSVSETFPQSVPQKPLITVDQVENRTVNAVVDSLSLQIDIWAEEKDQVRQLEELANEAVMHIGFLRDYDGAIEQYRSSGGGFFRKIMRFGRKVDKRTLRLID